MASKVVVNFRPTGLHEIMSHYGLPSRGNPFKDGTPMPDNIPKVDEIGATSAPLKSASFFIGKKCKEFNGNILSYVSFDVSLLIPRL